MAKIVTEQTNVVKGTPTRNTTAQTVSSQEMAESPDTMAYLVYFFFGVLEVLLAFRFFLKMSGANPTSGFVRFIYSVTQFFIGPFEGIFRRATTEGIEVRAIFEPSTVVAIVVYAFLAWGIIELIGILAGKTPEE